MNGEPRTGNAFPIFLTPSYGRALVIGSGRVATRKVETLGSYGFSVVQLAATALAVADLGDFALVVAATRDAAFNRQVSEACQARHIPVNVVDNPTLCTFYFGASARKGPLTVAVSSSGTCPVAAQVLRDRIAPLLTDALAQTTERLGAAREHLKETWPDPHARAAALRKEFEKC